MPRIRSTQAIRFRRDFPALERVLTSYSGSDLNLIRCQNYLHENGYIQPIDRESVWGYFRQSNYVTESDRFELSAEMVRYVRGGQGNTPDTVWIDEEVDESEATAVPTPLIEDAENPGRARAARVGDIAGIHNGEYEIILNNLAMRYLIYTPQTGPLAGMRVIKRRPSEAPDTWKGFAFLGRDGTLVLWERFQQDRLLAYVARAKLLLAALQFYTSSPPRTMYEGATVTLVQRSCVQCNVLLPTTGLGSGYCTQHDPSIIHNLTVHSDPDSHYDALTQVAYRNVSGTNPPSRVARARARRTPASTEPPLSQLGTGELL